MAINPIILQGTVARAQDFTTIKHQENTKATVDQSNFQQQFSKEVEVKTHTVHEGDNSDFQNKKFDAKEKGNGSYSGDGGKQRKEKEKPIEQVTIKGRSSFDIKI